MSADCHRVRVVPNLRSRFCRVFDIKCPAFSISAGKRCIRKTMKYSEEAINDGVFNPVIRLLILLFGTWLIGSLYPIPETIYHLIRGPEKTWYGSVVHTPQWFDFQFLPVLGAFNSKTALVSAPIAFFCIVCSALDRWSWQKVTALSCLSTFSMNILDDLASQSDWMLLTLFQALIVTLLVMAIRTFRQA